MSTSVCVCVYVCLRGYLRNYTHDLYQIFCACCLWPWLRQPPAGWRNLKGKGAVLGVFFPIGNALYSIAFGTHTKTAKPIEMPFGIISEFGPRNSVLRGGDDPRRGKGNFVKTRPTSLTPIWIANWTGPCSGTWHDRGRRLIASVGRVYYRPRRGLGCTPRAKSDIYDCIVLFCSFRFSFHEQT